MIIFRRYVCGLTDLAPPKNVFVFGVGAAGQSTKPVDACVLEEKGKMAKLIKKAGDFVLDVAAKQYKRSMTRKLNAFGECKGREIGGVAIEMSSEPNTTRACTPGLSQRFHARPPRIDVD